MTLSFSYPEMGTTRSMISVVATGNNDMIDLRYHHTGGVLYITETLSGDAVIHLGTDSITVLGVHAHEITGPEVRAIVSEFVISLEEVECLLRVNSSRSDGQASPRDWGYHPLESVPKG